MDVETGISLKELLIGVIGLLIAGLTWFLSGLSSKIEKLQEKKLDKTDYKDAMLELKKEFRDTVDRQTKLLIHLFNKDE
jgi:hypothetical protein